MSPKSKISVMENIRKPLIRSTCPETAIVGISQTYKNFQLIDQTPLALLEYDENFVSAD